ncbi:unnamed protein product [Rotaria sp. Silwood1]|nr:unnamed protein product [Rotaria sp. Silwood1]
MICGVRDDIHPGVTNSIILWNETNWAMSCDFNGNDLSYIKISSELCRDKCVQIQLCTHYTWTNWNGGTCWMKKGNVSKDDAHSTNDKNMICGIVNNTQQGVTNSIILWNETNWAMSCDFHGNDLSHVEISSELCRGKCAQTQQCTHYTWTNWNGGTCWMKKGNVSRDDAFLTNNPTMICDQTVYWNGQNWARSCEFPGNDLSNVQVSADRCGPACLQVKDCTHYTWTTLNGGTCWMKKGNVSKADAVPANDTNMICGVRDYREQGVTNSTVQWSGTNCTRSCDFYGNDLSSIQISPKICGLRCAQSPLCTHYTWNYAFGGTCWMKKGNVSKDDAFPTNDPSMVCGIRDDSQQCVTIFTVEWNGATWTRSCDFFGNDLSHIEISAELCSTTCLQTKECTHYSWSTLNGGTCWVKKGNVSKDDAFSTNVTTTICGIITSVKNLDTKHV